MTKAKKKKSIGSIVVTSLLVAFIAIGIVYKLSPSLESFRTTLKLDAYKDDIEMCVNEAQKSHEDTIILGLDYSCAVEVAATFFEEDEEKAILLCATYNPVFKRSYLTDDDPYARSQKNMIFGICKSSIKREIERQNSELNSQNEPPSQAENMSTSESITDSKEDLIPNDDTKIANNDSTIMPKSLPNTYIDNRNSFSIRYPDTWHFMEQGEPDQTLLQWVYFKKITTSGGKGFDTINVRVYSNKDYGYKEQVEEYANTITRENNGKYFTINYRGNINPVETEKVFQEMVESFTFL